MQYNYNMEHILSNKVEEIEKIIAILESLNNQIDDSELTMRSKQLYAEFLGQMYMDRKDIIKTIEGIIKRKYKPTKLKKTI